MKAACRKIPKVKDTTTQSLKDKKRQKWPEPKGQSCIVSATCKRGVKFSGGSSHLKNIQAGSWGNTYILLMILSCIWSSTRTPHGMTQTGSKRVREPADWHELLGLNNLLENRQLPDPSLLALLHNPRFMELLVTVCKERIHHFKLLKYVLPQTHFLTLFLNIFSYHFLLEKWGGKLLKIRKWILRNCLECRNWNNSNKNNSNKILQMKSITFIVNLYLLGIVLATV